METIGIVNNDPWLKPFEPIIQQRFQKAADIEKKLIAGRGTLKDFATGHLYYGLHKTENGWTIREWAPNASMVFLIGEFTGWKKSDGYAFKSLENGNWELNLTTDAIHHKELYKLLVVWDGGEGERLPSYANRVIQDPETKIFSAQVWVPESKYKWSNESPAKEIKVPFIYEAHVGMSGEEEKISTFDEFRKTILPRIARAGYNTIQLMAIQEHPYYGSFGYHVSNFFSASSRFGTPDDLKSLIDTAHGLGICVIMDLVHSHAVKNELEGLGRFDGTPYQYFHDGYRREHVAWDSLCFNYSKEQVLHFLLSNCQYWLDEYHFDGFRFDGVTSMLYLDHGLGRDFTSYEMYYDGGQDEDAIAYLTLANKLIHEVKPSAITIAEEMSGFPGLATPLEDGGIGFDFRLAMGTPDFWIKLIKEVPDENWNVRQIYHELSQHRADEKTIGYAESHDQALVGDKTIIFRLMDKEMYFSMNKDSKNLIVDRGMALHKMIRLISLASAGGGYLNFIGNEFGHPEWIDFPREGNNWSHFYARRQWSLVENKALRYHQLADFDNSMVHTIKASDCLQHPFPYAYHQNEDDQVLVFGRGSLLFVFNFNPVQSFTDYGITVPAGKYKIVLNSDDPMFGGFGRIDASITHFTQPASKMENQHMLKLYLPNRVGLILEKRITPSVHG